MPRRRPRALLAAVSWPQGRAASLSVAPTRIDLGPATAGGGNAAEQRGRAGHGAGPDLAWPRSPASADLEPTRELLAVPPVFELAGNGKQIIRVALRAPLAGDRERAYRLLITEVPRGGDGHRRALALRLSLPVFATPGRRPAGPVWPRWPTGAGRAQVVNRGTAHLQVRRIVLRARGRARSPCRSSTHPAYVLPGPGAGRWPLGDLALAARHP